MWRWREGLLAFTTLIALHFVIAWLSVRSQTVSKFVQAEPTLILYRGRFLHDAMRRERVTEAEVRCAVRQGGYADLGAAECVVLETKGTFSIVARREDGPSGAPSMSGVRGFAAQQPPESGVHPGGGPA